MSYSHIHLLFSSSEQICRPGTRFGSPDRDPGVLLYNHIMKLSLFFHSFIFSFVTSCNASSIQITNYTSNAKSNTNSRQKAMIVHAALLAPDLKGADYRMLTVIRSLQSLNYDVTYLFWRLEMHVDSYKYVDDLKAQGVKVIGRSQFYL